MTTLTFLSVVDVDGDWRKLGKICEFQLGLSCLFESLNPCFSSFLRSFLCVDIDNVGTDADDILLVV
jgi:hypothetical protein